MVCPDCKGAVTYYHDTESTKIVCKNKCCGWKIIQEIKLGGTGIQSLTSSSKPKE